MEQLALVISFPHKKAVLSREVKGFEMDPVIKKQALRMFTYGLYIVMCAEGDEVNGFTANWLTQVSFEPPLLAVSVENSAKSLPMILRSRTFTVNVLSSDKQGRKLAGDLGKSALKHPDKMEHIQYALAENIYPVLLAGLAWVACDVRHTAQAGDSTLLVAEIVDAGVLAQGQSLTMAEAGFRHAG
jgi:flavin reductase (DIM6/NTAB) family NADH-FMN oxidoreductase RutF